ncbi:hypothetical protein CAEBREN_09221 [Caenorhabditis brenneri]|uniref:FAM86 N-terminal domain-containing protein n=1 Tax=Caenorhabditis brenneri TaxID=135651 RepID=G0NB36_CAEBE|nr:hypothetical protein CAEBREN_09221 [Caenorhabditis brenneri]
MVSHTQDPNTFLLIPHILSEQKLRTSKRCQESEKLNETDQSEKEIIEFKRFFCSASKIPDDLLRKIVKRCKEEPHFAEKMSENVCLEDKISFSQARFLQVFNCKIVTSHKIRYQFQVNVIKLLISELEKDGVAVPDSIFDRLGDLMGMKEGKYVERLYLTESGNEVLSKFTESVNQLSMGTTGLAVWQASADLANLFRLIPSKEYKRVVELGSGCGVSGISVAKLSDCQVVLTDYDDNVLELLKENALKNDLMSEKDDPSRNQAKIRCLDWCDFDFTEWKESADLIIAADSRIFDKYAYLYEKYSFSGLWNLIQNVVYDTALLASLCNVLRLLLRHSKAAIVACTRRNENSIECFEHHLKCTNLEIVERFEYENGTFRLDDNSSCSFPTIFPFFSTLKTPTIFYNIQPKNKLV